MARDIANMRVVLGANITKFRKGMRKATSTLKKFDKRMGGMLSKMGKSVPLAAAAAGAAIVAMTVKMAKWGDTIAKQSKALGVSTEFLSEMDFVAQRAGASMGDVTKSIGLLAKAAVDASNGLTTYTRAFEDLGVDFRDVNGELKLTEDLFMDVIQGLADMSNETERLGIAKQLLGRGGAGLIPLVYEDIGALRELAKVMGRSLTPEQAKNAEDFADAMLNVKSAVEGLIVEATLDKGGPVITFIDKLTDGMIKFNATYKENRRLSEERKQKKFEEVFPVGGLKPADGLLASKVGWELVEEAEAKALTKLKEYNEEAEWQAKLAKARIGLLESYSGDAFVDIEKKKFFPAMDMPSPLDPIIKDLPGLMQINAKLEKTNDIVIIGSDVMREYANDAARAADITANFASDFYSSMKSGEGAIKSFGEAFTRMAEDILFQLIRMKTEGFFFDMFTSKAGGGSTSSGGNYFNPYGGGGLLDTGSIGGGSGSVTVNLNNGSGMPLDVGSAQVSTGANGQTQLDLTILSGLSNLASTGRLDKVMRVYGARRQGVSR